MKARKPQPKIKFYSSFFLKFSYLWLLKQKTFQSKFKF
ncbi:hypothetical protein HMPREF1139_0987 [Campylobacter sp. FOBRC14]|nr:hypothetical protein HMPREF1139_0987 [Campylobacter sp. FOBRC14]